MKRRALNDLHIFAHSNKPAKHLSPRTSLKQDRTSVVFFKDLQNPFLRGSLRVETPGSLQSTPYNIEQKNDSGPCGAE